MTDSEYFCQDRSVSVLVYVSEVSDPSFPLFPTGSVDWSPEDFLQLVNCCHSWLVQLLEDELRVRHRPRQPPLRQPRHRLLLHLHGPLG